MEITFQFGNMEAKVSELIDYDLGQWKSEEVRDRFIGSDVQHILSIPISRSFPEDKLIWHHDKEGIYSVKTTYHVITSQKQNQNSGLSSNSNCWKSRGKP